VLLRPGQGEEGGDAEVPPCTACPISRGGERRLGPRTPFPVDEVCGWWDARDSGRRQALEEFARWGARVLLVHTPCGDWQRYEHFDGVQAPELRVRAVNALYSRMPGVEIADLFERICPGGRYSDEVEGYAQAAATASTSRPRRPRRWPGTDWARWRSRRPARSRLRSGWTESRKCLSIRRFLSDPAVRIDPGGSSWRRDR
jgi:hypothetical protein